MERGKEPKLLEIQRRWKLKSAAVAGNMEDTVTGASLSAVKVEFLSNQVKQMNMEQMSAEHVLIVEQMSVEYNIKLKHRCGGSFASALNNSRYLEI